MQFVIVGDVDANGVHDVVCAIEDDNTHNDDDADDNDNDLMIFSYHIVPLLTVSRH